MKIADILIRERVIAELKSTGKQEVIQEMTAVLPSEVMDLDRVVQVLMERERLGSTGIGEGVAIPHGKIPGLNSLIAAFGRSSKGVEFESLDGKPAHLFFLLVAPEDSAGAHLKALARISRLFKDGQFRKVLMGAKGVDEIYEAILEEDQKYG
ncbi:MAG: PTS sugar transporter subunit IIA [bacterium]